MFHDANTLTSNLISRAMETTDWQEVENDADCQS